MGCFDFFKLYGLAGLFISIISFVTTFVINDAHCISVVKNDYNKMLPLNIATTIFGAITFAASYFDVAKWLSENKCVFFFFLIFVFAVLAGLIFWSSGIAYADPCVKSILNLNIAINKNNSFQAGDKHNIATMFLDMFAGTGWVAVAVLFFLKL